MSVSSTSWPRKTRELHSHHFDSTIWNDLVFRDDDIVISTYAKAGTTWVQQMIGQMMHGGDPDLFPFWSFRENVRSWWAIRDLPNLKANATKSVPLGGAFWDAGAGVFINKGRNGVWRDELTDEDIRRYEAELGADAAAWLEH